MELSGDLYLIDWLEALKIPYDVFTDADLHSEGVDLLSSYKVVITGGHPEYVTERMLDALEQYVDRGGRMMYLGGNGFYWVTTIDPEDPALLEIGVATAALVLGRANPERRITPSPANLAACGATVVVRLSGLLGLASMHKEEDRRRRTSRCRSRMIEHGTRFLRVSTCPDQLVILEVTAEVPPGMS